MSDRTDEIWQEIADIQWRRGMSSYTASDLFRWTGQRAGKTEMATALMSEFWQGPPRVVSPVISLSLRGLEQARIGETISIDEVGWFVPPVKERCAWCRHRMQHRGPYHMPIEARIYPEEEWFYWTRRAVERYRAFEDSLARCPCQKDPPDLGFVARAEQWLNRGSSSMLSWVSRSSGEGS